MWLEYLYIFEVVVGLVSAIYVVGFGLALHAVMKARTAQGAIAWALSLLTLPYLTVPLYLIFGRGRFYGYVSARRARRAETAYLLQRLRDSAPVKRRYVGGRLQALERIALLPATGGNVLKILVDGQESFPAMHATVAAAKQYILVQFYIVREDHIGQEFADALIAKAKEGVSVFFLYDEIGSYGLSSHYIERLRANGINIHRFNTTKGFRNRFQINFRNHRKIVLSDGKQAVIGGMNLGREYNGEDPHVGFWRDTGVQINGPAASCVQMSFVEDWYWAQGNIPDLFWETTPLEDGHDVLILPTGPTDELENCSLFFVQSIHAAKKDLWIASPYFVPDSAVISALQLAALRGVNVRIILPANPDHKLVYMAGFYYISLMQQVGIKVYRYKQGFMHQKVMLVDKRLAAIGSANLDNRSFRLNFEITMASFDEDFSTEVQAMLENDLKQCALVEEHLSERSLGFRLLVRLAVLLSPIL